MKKTFAGFLAFVLMFSMSISAYAAGPTSASKISAEDQRFVESMKNVIADWESPRTIASIKPVLDFAGNEYTVVECSPVGYIIFNNEAALILESSESSPSPYLGLSGPLYYAGPTHYYSYNPVDNTYSHSVLNKEVSLNEIEARVEVCRSAQIELLKQTDSELKAYLESGISASNNVSRSSSTDNTYVGDNKDFFVDMDTAEEMSYWATGNGACGYVASSIVLLYYHNFHDDNIIDTETYPLTENTNGDYFSGEDFTAYLYQTIGVNTLGYSNSLNANKVATVMRTYLSNDRDITVNTWYANMPSVSTVISHLGQDRPVVYVDRWNDPSRSGGATTDHDIVVYGYNSSNNKLIAHFGWEGYTHIEATSGALALFISSACCITTY